MIEKLPFDLFSIASNGSQRPDRLTAGTIAKRKSNRRHSGETIDPCFTNQGGQMILLAVAVAADKDLQGSKKGNPEGPSPGMGDSQGLELN